jgi:hypothetical protein
MVDFDKPTNLQTLGKRQSSGCTLVDTAGAVKLLLLSYVIDITLLD